MKKQVNPLLNKKIAENTLEFLLYLAIACMGFYLFKHQAENVFPSDLNTHIYFAISYVENDFFIPHPGFHLLIYGVASVFSTTVFIAAPYVLVFFLVLSFLVVNRLILFPIIGARFRIFYIFLCFSAGFTIAIYLPTFSKSFYVGHWSPNIWHSPTMILLKAFAIWSFVLCTSFFIKNGKLSILQFFLCSGALVASAFVKPSFVIAFLPACGLFLLIYYPKNHKVYLNALLIVLPVLLLLGYQYFASYMNKGENSQFNDNIVFTFFGVFKLYTKSVVLSTILVLAFPLSLLFLKFHRVRSNKMLVMAWFTLGFAFLEAGFIAEEKKFNQGAFCFGYIIALFIVFVFSLQETIKWLQEINNNRFDIVRKSIVMLLYVLHFVSGIVYFDSLLKGALYF